MRGGSEFPWSAGESEDMVSPVGDQANLDTRKERLEAECEDTEHQLVYRSEANLFGVERVAVSAKEVVCLIKAARESADRNELAAARCFLVRAVCRLDEAVAQRGRLWLWVHVYAVPLWVYHTAVVSAAAFVTIRFDLLHPPVGSGTSCRVLVAMGVYGILGGEVRGLYWLYRKVEGRAFRAQFFFPHFGGPVLSCVLGVLSFVTLNAGPGIGYSPISEAPLYGYGATAALAGFGWDWFVKKLNQAGR